MTFCGGCETMCCSQKYFCEDKIGQNHQYVTEIGTWCQYMTGFILRWTNKHSKHVTAAWTQGTLFYIYEIIYVYSTISIATHYLFNKLLLNDVWITDSWT